MNCDESVIDEKCLSDINNRILGAHLYCCKKNDRPPLFYPSGLRKDSILFVGLNPSFNEKALQDFFDSILKSAPEHVECEYKNFYELFNCQGDWDYFEKKIPCLQNLERLAKRGCGGLDHYRYYNKFEAIVKEINKVHPNFEWEHIDLFFLRETDQKKLKEVIVEKDNPDGIELNRCGCAQLNIALDLLKCLEPKVIVVANALASRIIGNEFVKRGSEYNLNFHPCCGYHTICLNKKRVPIFFSSMLSGQRALDLCSLERLIWHINLALKNGGKHGSYAGLTTKPCFRDLEK